MSSKTNNSEKHDDKGNFALSLKGAGVEIQREITTEQALAVIQVSMRQESGAAREAAASIAGAESDAAPASSRAPRAAEFSLGEYIHKVGAKRNPEKILAIASYLKELGQDRFSKADVKAKFPEAGEKVPGNYPRDFTWALRNKWIAVAPDEKDQYYVTRTGEKDLAAGFTQAVRRATATKRGRRKRGKAE